MHRVNIGSHGLFFAILFVLLLTAGCNYRPVQRDAQADPTAAPGVAAESPTPEPTQPSDRLLTICMGQEPASLFLYADAGAAARAVRQAIYDGPFDVVNNQLAPVILEAVPTLADGSVIFEPVAVQAGNLIVDASGKAVKLADGVRVLPAGCADGACAIDFSTQTPVQLDQMVVRYRLRQGVTWSDGEALLADDSVYSYELARAMYPRVRAELMDRTVSYQALDELTVEWRGAPGYRTPGYVTHFFTPLPRHAWGSLPAADLPAAEAVSRKPVGWGPYQIDEWISGDHISMSRNPAYFRQAEGLPVFEKLVFRFIPDRNQALSALTAGECDFLDETNHLEVLGQQIAELQSSGAAEFLTQPGSAWEHLDFGIQSINTPENGGPLPFFAVKEVRQATATCIDRQRLATELFAGNSAVPDSYVAGSHPLFNPDVRRYSFDPEQAGAWLDAAGWLDTDANASTPRVAQGVAGIPDGTPFEVTLLTSDEDEKQRAAQIIQESLAQCGIKINISAAPIESVFAPGPEGAVFGRNFSLAQFGWVSGAQPPCFLYTTEQIPGPYPEYIQGWGGANAAGYSNAEFDRACQTAFSTLPDTPEHRAAHFTAQSIYAEDLPSLPLYLRLKTVATRPDFCGAALDPSGETALWNLESFDYGEACR